MIDSQDCFRFVLSGAGCAQSAFYDLGKMVASSVGKPLVKSPKVYVKDSGLVHAVLAIETAEQLGGHPIMAASWEGFAIESLLTALPRCIQLIYHCSFSGAEVYLLLELSARERWSIKIKCGLTAKIEYKGCCRLSWQVSGRR